MARVRRAEMPWRLTTSAVVVGTRQGPMVLEGAAAAAWLSLDGDRDRGAVIDAAERPGLLGAALDELVEHGLVIVDP